MVYFLVRGCPSSKDGHGVLCHWLGTVGKDYWLGSLPNRGCRVGSEVVWVLWSHYYMVGNGYCIQ